MAREKRKVSASGIYKVTLRANDEVIFKDKCDYDEFISLSDKYFSGEKAVLAYSLDKDGASIIVMTGEESIGSAMKPFLTSYARYYNRTYRRKGKVFYDRYASEPIDADMLEAAISALPDGTTVKTEKTVRISAEKPEQNENVQSETETEKEVSAHNEGGAQDKRQMDFWLL